MNRNREIIVKGIGKSSIAPDLIIIEMRLETIDLQYEKTMKNASELIEILRSAVISVGHDGDELKTTQFNIDTKYERYKVKEEWKERFIGYSCLHKLKLEFNLNMSILGATMNAISKCNAKPKFQIKFSIKDPTEVSEKLLKDAIENARIKANILSESAGVKLGKIVRIDYNWSELHMYSNIDMDMEDAEYCYLSEDINITPDNINVKDSATIVWEIDDL